MIFIYDDYSSFVAGAANTMWGFGIGVFTGTGASAASTLGGFIRRRRRAPRYPTHR